MAINRWQRTILLIGSIGPLGWSPASGTVTVAVIGLPLFWWTRGVSLGPYLAGLVLLALAATWLHHVGDALLQQKDSRRLVWDELVGFMIAVIAVPFTWQLAFAALVLQRGCDILKVPPARWIEKNCAGGWGVVGDDVVAGLYTLGLLHALIYYAPGVVGLSG